MTDLESIRKRLEEAPKGPWTGDRYDGTVKYDVLDADGETVIHGCNGNEDPSYGIRDDAAEQLILNAPTDIAFLLGEVERLTIERDDYASQAKAERGRWRPISERAERAEVVAKSIRAALGHGADENLWPVGLTVAGAVARLVDRVATAKDEERAAVVAHADAEAARMTGNGDDVGARFVRAFGDAIESNRHREKA